MKVKKVLSMMLAGACVLGMLSGCGNKDDGGQQAGGTVENPEEISAELTLWDASWNENITPGTSKSMLNSSRATVCRTSI